MILLLDIGNTRTHLALANARALVRHSVFPTAFWQQGKALRKTAAWLQGTLPKAMALCSVVPPATALARQALRSRWDAPWFELTACTVSPVLAIRYPRPSTIGPDRLANAIAARRHYGAPCVAIDFGTAVTFDVVDETGCFVGGVIAPGLSLMTRSLHEQTALLPQIRLGPVRRAIGRSTREAIRIAAVHGFPGLVRELILRLKQDLKRRRLPVIATGGDARWVAARVPEISAIAPHLTLEGLRLACQLHLES